jgi:predicted ester cyclase
MKLAVGLIVLTSMNIPAARSQNSAPPPTTAQSPTSASSSSSSLGAQTPGAAPANPAAPTGAAPAASQQAAPAPEYPLLPGVGPADTLPRRYIEMWNIADFRLLNGMFIQFPRLHYPGVSSLAMPLSMVANRINIWRNCLPDLKYEILDTIVQGDKVAMRTAYTGTYTKQCFNDVPGPVAGEPLEKIKIEEMLLFGLEQGKIADIWEQYDQLGARLQMGATWCNTPEPAASPSPQAPPPAEPSSQPPPAASPNSAPSSPPPSKP